MRFFNTGPSGPRSVHRLKSWTVCERLTAFEKFRPDLLAPVEHFVKGEVIHAGIGHALAREVGMNDYALPEDAIRRAAAPHGAMGEAAALIARRLAVTFIAWWRDRAPKPKVLAIERTFEFSVKGPRTGRVWTYTQKPDAIIEVARMQTQEDHKSTGAFAKATTMSRYAPDIQFLAKQWWGPQMFGSSYGGAKINLLNKREPFQIKQAACAPAPRLVRDFPMIAEENELQMEAAEARNGSDPWKYKPAADERVCVNSYGPCRAWRACLWGSEGPGRGAGALVNINLPSEIGPAATAADDEGEPGDDE